ncbi:hypothetical protein DV532_26395 (plasmid) [Pseudomonas sp. Leaf58]|uniref:hypothetical protein n=1 Tax=Pseudomonas sp. Leaf58 TaxID=1736226 RepID=UPI0006FC17BE|nr:hypothetical protein [Pseudomonas sp. Leaf58]AYG47816.1 hypothetical protein DV532_26395 [Pseudomonas sp. Leaf58]KQN62616.1 hypothetical protein ASF02_10745 [Pseudomonas sp. Leaf58]
MIKHQQNSRLASSTHHRGFEIRLMEGSDVLSISLEGREIAKVDSLTLAKEHIDFYHAATDASFSLSRQRVATAQELGDAEPEPELAHGKINTWIKWYRNASGCGLREAHEEGMRRLREKGA